MTGFSPRIAAAEGGKRTHSAAVRFLLLTASVLVAVCESSTAPRPTFLPEHLTLGNLSGATAEVDQPTNYLLAKPRYTLSYHRGQGKPNWVSMATRVIVIGAPSENGLDGLSAVSSAVQQVVEARVDKGPTS